jgi:hypothetical protein
MPVSLKKSEAFVHGRILRHLRRLRVFNGLEVRFCVPPLLNQDAEGNCDADCPAYRLPVAAK